MSQLGRKRLRAIAKSLKKLPKDPRYRDMKASLSLDINARKMKGGRDAFVEHVRSAAKENVQLQAFLLVWDYLPASDRRQIPLDMVCDAAQLPRKSLLGAVAAEACAQGNDVANLIMGDSIGDVTRAAVRQAIKPRGHEDRKMLLTARGLMPVSKGATFVNNVMQSQIVRPPTEVPSFEDDVLEISGSETEFLPEPNP